SEAVGDVGMVVRQRRAPQRQRLLQVGQRLVVASQRLKGRADRDLLEQLVRTDLLRLVLLKGGRVNRERLVRPRHDRAAGNGRRGEKLSRLAVRGEQRKDTCQQWLVALAAPACLGFPVGALG